MSAAMKGTIVGSLACQKDSYLKSFATTVLSCTPVKSQQKKSSKGKSDESDNDQLYRVELENTILFPEGGGQPADNGTMTVGESTIVHVTDVQRENLRAIHYVNAPVESGNKVSLQLNWKRRLDHMQQHTGQHLLSAVLDRYELPTLSWSMGEVINYIEIPRKLTEEELDAISEAVNNEILSNEPIEVEYPTAEEDNLNLEKGIMRVVHIGKLDSNPCCGTHLESTGHIKAIVLLNQFSGKGGASRLNFICGDRLINYTRELHEITKKLMTTLSGSLEDLNTKAATVVQQGKKYAQREKSLLTELAIMKANELKGQLKQGKQVVYAYRADADLSYLNTIYKELGDIGTGTVVLLTGEVRQPGAVIISGGEKSLEVTTQLKSILKSLKGGGKGKFQGKVSEYSKGELEEVLAYLKSL